MRDDINMSMARELGESYFSAHPEAALTKLDSSVGPFEFEHNEKRELSLVTFSCRASSALLARQKFVEGVMPFFDYLSFRADVPLAVDMILCEDQKNHVRTINYISPHPVVVIASHVAAPLRELAPIYALYREAKNSASPFYKFLCFFKILEGVYRHIRAETFRRARLNGIKVEKKRECVPDHPELGRGVVGQPIEHLFRGRFEKNFRNRVAHYILDSGKVLNVSDAAASTEFLRELLLLQLCARVVVQTQEYYCAAANGHLSAAV